MKKNDKWITYVCIFALGILLGLGNIAAVYAASKQVTVSTQEKLNDALKDKSITKIIIKTEKETKYSIKKGNYSKKQLIVNAPKATITNNGSFENISINNTISGNGKWIENGREKNRFVINCEKTHIDVKKNAVVKSISVEKKQSHIKVTCSGKISSIQLNKSSEIVINSSSKGGNIKVNVYEKNCKITDRSSNVYLKNLSLGNVELITKDGKIEAPKGYSGTVTNLVKKMQQKEDKLEEEKEKEIRVVSASGTDTKKDESKVEEIHVGGGSIETTKKANSILSQIIQPNMSEYAKVQAVYDWMTKNIVYDEWYTLGKRLAGSPEGALLHGRAICSGYARTFKLFMDLLGIQCKEVSGLANGIVYDVENHDEEIKWDGHAWNLVNIYGNWYHVDATWDAGENNVYEYDYFLLTDEEMGSKEHKDWQSALPAANKKADFWDEYIALRGNQLKQVNNIEEIQEDLDKCTKVGTYVFEYYSDSPLWQKLFTSGYCSKRKDVLSQLSLQTRKGRGQYYFFSYQYTIEMKYEEVKDTNPELENFVRNETELFDKLDVMALSGEDLVFTCADYFNPEGSLVKWAAERGYFTSYYFIRDNIKYEKITYNTGCVQKITIPRKCFQCSAKDNYIDLEFVNLNSDIDVIFVNTTEDFERLVDPLFEDRAASYAFSESVIPMWECTEEDILDMLNKVARKYGYSRVELQFPLEGKRVSFLNYCYHIFAGGITVYR